MNKLLKIIVAALILLPLASCSEDDMDCAHPVIYEYERYLMDESGANILESDSHDLLLVEDVKWRSDAGMVSLLDLDYLEEKEHEHFPVHICRFSGPVDEGVPAQAHISIMELSDYKYTDNHVYEFYIGDRKLIVETMTSGDDGKIFVDGEYAAPVRVTYDMFSYRGPEYENRVTVQL